MLMDKILALFDDCAPDVKNVLARVLEKERAMLSYDKPPGLVEDIRHIIDAEVRGSDET